MIGIRTKEALRQAKLRGVQLGSNIPTVKLAAEEGKKAKAKRTMDRLAPIFLDLHAQGIQTGSAIAFHLNGSGIQSASGKPWSRQTAYKFMKKVLELRAE